MKFDHYDESDVKIRSGRGSRPRTKIRPTHHDAQSAMIVSVDRGRWGCVLHQGNTTSSSPIVTAMRARELGRRSIVVGDNVDIIGDLNAHTNTLARIVRRHPRHSVLRRTADDSDPSQRIIVANADQLLIVVSVVDPPPRTGLVDRALIAAYAGNISPILCLTKTDLACADQFIQQFYGLDLPIVLAGQHDSLNSLRTLLANKVTALIGHSGVGKSTLINRLVPHAHRPTGELTSLGRGRHTSTQSRALSLEIGGWVIDTPGIRSFGLAHVEPHDVLGAFHNLFQATQECPRGCSHLGPPTDPECKLDQLPEIFQNRVTHVRRLLTVAQEISL